MAGNGGHLEGLETGRKRKELLVLERPALKLMRFGEDAFRFKKLFKTSDGCFCPSNIASTFLVNGHRHIHSTYIAYALQEVSVCRYRHHSSRVPKR
jgi:hypothetical protein